MDNAALPLVMPDADSGAFWQAIREGRLIVQKCVDCGSLRVYSQAFCPVCLGEQIASVPCAGTGRVYTFTTVLRPPTPAFNAQVPYHIALIDLDEGARLLARVRDGGGLRIGARVRAVFNDPGAALALPIFETID